MFKIPPAVERHFAATLLGKLKLKVYRQIGADEGYEPEGPDQVRWLLSELRQSWHIGLLGHHLLTLNRTTVVPIEQLPAAEELPQVLRRLEERYQRDVRFLELTGNKTLDPLGPENIGVLVYSEDIKPSGLVFVLTFLAEDAYPQGVIGRVEVRASIEAPEPAFEVLGPDGYVHYSQSTYLESSSASLAARVLALMATTPRRKWRPVPVGDRDSPPMRRDFVPPADSYFEQLIRDVAGRRIQMHRTDVPIDIVRPFSFEFALNLPLEVVKELADETDESNQSPLVLYWSGGQMVMSDDYPRYLAYKMLGTATVPAVIMGDYPRDIAKPTRSGYLELMPPAMAREATDVDSLDGDVKQWLLDGRLSRRPFGGPPELISAFLSIAHALADPHVSEYDLRRILTTSPSALEPLATCVRAEVPLGKAFRVDLAITQDALDRGPLLVELEHPRDSIFNRAGRPRKKVVHAIQQVEDWLRWWRLRPDEVPAGLRRDLTPSGLVVIGRDVSLTSEGRERLEHLNQNRQVKVITYDELLKRLETMIMGLGGAAAEPGAGHPSAK